MRDFRDGKAMAQTLREALQAKSVSLTHSESLELVARVLGFHDWNVLSARIQSEHQPLATKPTALPSTSTGLPTMPVRDLVLFPKMVVPLIMAREASNAPWSAPWQVTNASLLSHKGAPTTTIPSRKISIAWA